MIEEEDPIEELHKIRQAIWDKAGGTPEAYADYYYEMGKKRLAAETPVNERRSRRKKIPVSQG